MRHFVILTLAVSALATIFAAAAAAQSPARATVVRIPPRFVENRGQWDSAILYAVKHDGLDILITKDGFTTSFVALDGESAGVPDGGQGARGSKLNVNTDVSGAAVRMYFGGMDAAARVDPGTPAPGVTHFLIGDEKIVNVPAFRSVVFRGVRPGVDVIFKESVNHNIEYEIVAAPGSDPSGLTLECEGADSVTIDSAGDLVARTAVGEIRQSAPRSFEVVEGGARRELTSDFAVDATGRVSWSVKGRNLSRRLVIDPEITYSSFFGGSGSDSGFGVATDTAGNAYLTGYTSSVNLPTAMGVFDKTYNGGFDAYVARLRSDGGDVDYVTYLGGKSQDQGLAILVDATGSATVVGATLSIDFPTTLNAYDRTFGFGALYGDAFVTKLDATGTSLVYSTYLGGNGDDVPESITLGPSNNVYIAGWTRSTNFITPVTASSAFDNLYGGTFGFDFGDGFLAVLKNDGSALLYGTLLGGSGADAAFGVALDSVGLVYLTGLAGQGFPKKGTAFQTYKGNGDCFVTCVDPNATGAASLVFSDYLGGAKQDFGTSIAIDASDALLICGATQSGDFPKVAGSFKTTYGGGGSDGFVVKMNTTGTQLGFSTFLGGSNQDACTTVKLDASGTVQIGGKTKSGNFPVTPGTFGPKYKGNTDGFVCKLSGSGVVLLTSGYLGANGADEVADMAIPAPDTLWVVGSTLSAPFPVTPDAFDKKFEVQEAIIAKIDMGPAPILCLNSSTGIEVAYDVGSPAPAAFLRDATNCGSPESLLSWQVDESVDAPWLSETPDNSVIVQGAAPLGVQIAMDPSGLAIGPYSTTLLFQNNDNVNNVVQVPVLLAVQDIVVVPFPGGETLTGTVTFEGKISVGAISAVKGMTLQLRVLGTTTPLQPRIQIVNSIGQAVYTKSLANKKATTALSYKFTTDGDFQLVIGGANQSTGDFAIETKVVIPADAKTLKKKNLGSKVDGGPIDLTRRLRGGAILNVTMDPPKPVSGPLTLSLLDPNGDPIDVSGFTQPFEDDGQQLVNVPVVIPGLYTIRVTGTATKKEKVNITITPTQPVGAGDLVLP